MLVIHFLTSARGVIVPEKMQNKRLKGDSADPSALEGLTYAVLQGVGQCAVLRIAQSSSGCSKRHGVQRYPLQPWSRVRWRLQHRHNIGNIWEILEIFGKYLKYLGNIGNIWEILEIFGKYWKYLAAAAGAAAQKETMNCFSSAEWAQRNVAEDDYSLSYELKQPAAYAADRYGPLEARIG